MLRHLRSAAVLPTALLVTLLVACAAAAPASAGSIPA